MAGFPAMSSQPTVDVTGTASTVTSSSATTAASTPTATPSTPPPPPPTSTTPPKVEGPISSASSFFADVVRFLKSRWVLYKWLHPANIVHVIHMTHVIHWLRIQRTRQQPLPPVPTFLSSRQRRRLLQQGSHSKAPRKTRPQPRSEPMQCLPGVFCFVPHVSGVIHEPLPLRSMEVMLQDPKMQEMMYPYLPEPMRNPETFNFVLKDPTMRKQLVSTLAQSVRRISRGTLSHFSCHHPSFASTEHFVRPHTNAGRHEQLQHQLPRNGADAANGHQPCRGVRGDQVGVCVYVLIVPRQMMQEMMKDPEMLTLMQQPKIQKAIMEITANPMAMMNYQTDPDVMKVGGVAGVLLLIVVHHAATQVMMKVNNLMMPKIAEAQQNSAQQPVQQ